MHAHAMRWFKNSRLARMSSGHYCVIRDLGLVKGGKGLRHHEVVLDLTWRGTWRGLVQFTRSSLRTQSAWREAATQEDAGEPLLVPQATRASRR
jgi:hypothetical protein